MINVEMKEDKVIITGHSNNRVCDIVSIVNGYTIDLLGEGETVLGRTVVYKPSSNEEHGSKIKIFDTYIRAIRKIREMYPNSIAIIE